MSNDHVTLAEFCQIHPDFANEARTAFAAIRNPATSPSGSPMAPESAIGLICSVRRAESQLRAVPGDTRPDYERRLSAYDDVAAVFRARQTLPEFTARRSAVRERRNLSRV